MTLEWKMQILVVVVAALAVFIVLVVVCKYRICLFSAENVNLCANIHKVNGIVGFY